MSARYPPPSSSSDPRYPRERSPPRGPDRRSTTTTYSDGGGPYSARRESPRDPPRGPKALVDGPRGGGYAPRGRGYLGRGADVRDRDFRDARDEPPVGPFARRGRGQEWSAPRERFDGRDRRVSPPPPRDRSRSPKEYRDGRDGPPSASSSVVSDLPPTRGRGGYRGRGGRDWDAGSRGRSINPDERESYRTRSRSRDREWDRQSRDDDRDREDWMRRDQAPPYRPESRDTTTTAASRPPLASRSTSTASVQQTNYDRYPQGFREEQDRKQDSTGVILAGIIKEDGAIKRSESERYDSRNASPPPQAPPVPAFGSIPTRASTTTAQGSNGRQTAAKEPTKEPPSAPKSDILSNAPTAPKAQQYLADISNDPPRGPGNPDRFPRTAPTVPSGPAAKGSAFEQSRNWSKTFPQTATDSTCLF